MAKDFRSDQIRVKAIIGTGSIAGAPSSVGLVFYSGSNASNWKGGTKTNLYTGVGDDVWMVVNGTPNNSVNNPQARVKGSVVLFKGDVVVSGTLWSERSIVEVDDAVNGNFQAPHQIIGGHLHLTGGNGIAKILVDPYTTDTGSPVAQRHGTVSFATVQGTGGNYSFSTQYPNKYKDVFFHVSGSRNVKNSNDRGVALFEGDVMVSGNLELSAESTFSLPGDFTIGGDLTVNGNDLSGSAGGAIRFDTPVANVLLAHGLKIGNDALTGSDGTVFLVHSGSGAVGITDDLQMSGDVIKNKHGDEVFRFHPSDEGSFGSVRRLYVSGTTSLHPAQLQLKSQNETGYSPSVIRFMRRGAPQLGVNPGLDPTRGLIGETQYWSTKANGNSAYSGKTFVEATQDWTSSPPYPLRWGVSLFAGNTEVVTTDKQFTVERGLVTVSGSLKIHGGQTAQNAKILDGAHNEVMHFSGSGDTTISNNLTVVGDLNVSGSTTSIGTTNLKVSDQLILLASGSTTPNTKGGIAIASGSEYSNTSLLWGAGEYDNSWRASRLDVQDGTRTAGLNTGETVRVEASGIRLAVGNNSHALLLTASVPPTDTTKTHMTASVSAGGILLDGTESIVIRSAKGIDLTPTENVNIPTGKKIIFGTGVSLTNENDDTLHVISEKLRLNSGTPSEIIFGSTTGNSKVRATPTSLAISGSTDIILHAAANTSGDRTKTRLLLSASSNDTIGGAVIILSSSVHTQGGANGDPREGFITLGAGVESVPGLFRVDRHRDVRVLISGSVGSTDSNVRGTTLVAGDLVVSGNTDFKGSTKLGSISVSNLTMNSTSADEPYLRFRDSSVQISRKSSNNSMMFIDTVGGPYSLQDLASLSVVDNTDVFTINHGNPSYIKTTGSFSFDKDNQYTTAVNGGSSNIYFYVSGSIGSADYSAAGGASRPTNGERGTAVFGGDVLVSGSVYQQTPTFISSLHTAYTTPDTNGQKQFAELTPGAGAVIDTNGSGIPVQLRNPSQGSQALLTITGSLGFQYSGAGNNARIHMQSANPFEFHNSAGNVFQLGAGSGGTNALFPGNNRLEFGGSSRYLYGHLADSVNRISLINTNTGGIVAVNAGGGSGHLAVTGSILPGADITHNLGSPEMRWANLYTGDLHLRNERGNWTIYEEPDMLVVVNNLTGKKYKMGLTPLEDEE